MATKLIAFRISGELLDRAQNLLGDDNIISEARSLFIDFIEQRSPRSNTDNSTIQTNREVIEDLKKRVSELEKINQQELITEIVDQKIKESLPVTGVLHAVNNTAKDLTPRQLLCKKLGISEKTAVEKIKKHFQKTTNIDPSIFDPKNMYSQMLEKLP